MEGTLKTRSTPTGRLQDMPANKFRTGFESQVARGSLLVVLALVVAISYWNSLGNDFVFDDRLIILDNRLVSHVEKIPIILLSDYWAGTTDFQGLGLFSDALYRPLVIVSYALNYAVGGTNPVGYRIVNIALHILVTWLVYVLALQLGVGTVGAVAGASLFAVHPIHVEAVTYIVGRAELMMTMGVLASLWLAGKGHKA